MTGTSRAASTAITKAAPKLPAFLTDSCLTREQASLGANEEMKKRQWMTINAACERHPAQALAYF